MAKIPNTKVAKQLVQGGRSGQYITPIPPPFPPQIMVPPKTKTLSSLAAKTKRVKKTTSKRTFTSTCYAYIGLLLEHPNTVFSVTEQRVAERMLSYGWLERVEVEVPDAIGAFKFTKKVSSFKPTVEGMAQFQDLHQFIPLKMDLDKIKKAVDGEDRKVKLIAKVKK